MEQDSKFPGNRSYGTFLSPFAAVPGQRESPAFQVGVRSEWTENVVGGGNE